MNCLKMKNSKLPDDSVVRPPLTKSIAPQFEFNQFMRDFFADPSNKGKTRKDATEAWKIVRNLPGSNKYKTSSDDK